MIRPYFIYVMQPVSSVFAVLYLSGSPVALSTVLPVFEGRYCLHICALIAVLLLVLFSGCIELFSHHPDVIIFINCLSFCWRSCQ